MTGNIVGVAGIFSGAVSGTTGTFTGNVGYLMVQLLISKYNKHQEMRGDGMLMRLIHLYEMERVVLRSNGIWVL